MLQNVRQDVQKKRIDPVVLNEWSSSLMDLVQNRVNKLKKIKRFRFSAKKAVLSKPIIKNYLQQLHDCYVLVPTDKAWNNISIICKNYYIQLLLNEIGLGDNKHTSAYSLSQHRYSYISHCQDERS